MAPITPCTAMAESPGIRPETGNPPFAGRKLSRPRVCAPFFRRDRLAAALACGLDPSLRLTLVTAGPGFGKTSAVADYLDGAGIPCAWVSLDRYDADLVPFLSYIVRAIAGPASDRDPEALALLHSAVDPRLAIPAVCAAIAEAIAERAPEGFILVLDDFHCVESAPPIRDAVTALIDYLPESTQLVIVSRTTPDLHTSQLRARKHLAEIGPEQLRLSRDEIGALVEALSGQALAPSELDRLESLTEGWAASVVLAAQSRSSVGAAPSIALVFDFLAQEVFEELDPQTQAFLLATCHLPAIEADFCARHLDIPDPARQIAGLVRRHLLLARGREDGLEYHYHPILQAFLKDRLVRHVEPERARAIRLAAGRSLEPMAADAALALYVEAELWDEVDRPLERVGREFIDQGRLDALAALIDAIPSDRRQQSAWALLYEGEIRRLWGEFGRALDLLEAAERQAGANAAVAGRAVALQAACLGSRGDPHMTGLAERALALLPPGDAAGRALAHNILGLALQAGDPAAAQRHLEAALADFERVGDAAGQAKVLHNLGLAYTRKGDFEQAMARYRQSLAQSERAGRHGAPATFNNLAIVQIYRGELEQAWRDAARGLDLAQRLGYRREEAWCLLTLSMAAKNQDDLAKAGAFAQEALAAGVALQDRTLEAQATAALAEVALKSGAPERARALIDSAIALRALPPDDPALVDYKIPQGEIWLALGQPDQAQAILDQALSALADSGLWYRLAQVHLGLARAHGARSDGAREAHHRQEARRIGLAHGYDDLLARAGPGGPEVVVSRPVAEFDLEILGLGEFKAFSSGAGISSKQWQGYKTKLVLAYLLLHRQGATRDQLGQALYGEEDVSRSAVLMLLSRLRQALEPVVPRNATSRFIQFRDGRYFFNFGARYRVDTEEFEFHREQAEGTEGAGRVAHLERALALYRGRYLADLPGAHWVDTTAEHFHARAVSAFEDVTSFHLDAGDPEAALSWAERCLAIDPCAESAHQAKMRALARMGNRPGALRQFQQLTEILDKELGVAPDRSSQALYRELQGR